MAAVKPRPSDQPAKPLRTWRPMILWTAATLLVLVAAAGVSWSIWSKRERDLLAEYGLAKLPGKIFACLPAGRGNPRDVVIDLAADGPELTALLEKCQYQPRHGRPGLPLGMKLAVDFVLDEDTRLSFMARGEHGRIFLYKHNRHIVSSEYKVPPQLAEFICRKLGLPDGCLY
jgi:hypothetical protein